MRRPVLPAMEPRPNAPTMIHQPAEEKLSKATLKPTHLVPAQSVHIMRAVTYSGMIWVIHQNTAHTTMPRAIMACRLRPLGGVIKAMAMPRKTARTATICFKRTTFSALKLIEPPTDRCGRLCMVFTAVAPRRLFEQLVCHLFVRYQKDCYNFVLCKFQELLLFTCERALLKLRMRALIILTLPFAGGCLAVLVLVDHCGRRQLHVG